MLRVGVFGSCRVHDPMKLASKNAELVYKTDGFFGYVHSAPDVLQALRMLQGELSAPHELYPLLSRNKTGGEYSIERRWNEYVDEVDVFVVEISSVRIFAYESYSLQINRFKQRVRELADGASGGEAFLMGSSEWLRLLDKAKGGALSDLDRSLIEAYREYEQSAEGLAEDLDAIAALLQKPVVFVGHVNTDRRGQPIRQRAVICQTLEEFAATGRGWFLDPTPIVQGYGYDKAMTDSAHFADDFQAFYSKKLVEKLLSWSPYHVD
ncbi:hypothetical protein [Brevundimonas sp.]|uniref:hypothetical protein n=1 Tax=Brevundimonas sp. TaxID=1871086 RepID=UPI0028AB1FD8|nr:hypothetical protein [Brevundimonas sp.]